MSVIEINILQPLILAASILDSVGGTSIEYLRTMYFSVIKDWIVDKYSTLSKLFSDLNIYQRPESVKCFLYVRGVIGSTQVSFYKLCLNVSTGLSRTIRILINENLLP